MSDKDLGADAAAVVSAGSSDTPQLPHVGHTPGPWQVEPHSDTDEVINVVSEYQVRADGIKVANWIAELDAQIDFDSDVDEQLDRVNANAHLIAAAPEMYEALKAIVGLANETIDGVGHRYTFDYRSPLGEQARRAIAKAEGRS